MLGKQSILLALVLLPKPSLGTSAQGSPGIALGCLHLLQSSGSKSGPGYKAVKKRTCCSGLPQPTAGGEEWGGGVPAAPIGERSPLGAVGKEHPWELSSPASLLPCPAGLGSRCAGSDEVMVLNIAISSQPFSPATPPGSRRPPAGSARHAAGCEASPGLCGAARAWCHSAALWARRPEDGDARCTPYPPKNPRFQRHAGSITSLPPRAVCHPIPAAGLEAGMGKWFSPSPHPAHAPKSC